MTCSVELPYPPVFVKTFLFDCGALERTVFVLVELLGKEMAGRPPLFALLSRVILSGMLAVLTPYPVEARNNLFATLLSEDEAVVAVACAFRLLLDCWRKF